MIVALGGGKEETIECDKADKVMKEGRIKIIRKFSLALWYKPHLLLLLLLLNYKLNVPVARNTLIIVKGDIPRGLS